MKYYLAEKFDYPNNGNFFVLTEDEMDYLGLELSEAEVFENREKAISTANDKADKLRASFKDDECWIGLRTSA